MTESITQEFTSRTYLRTLEWKEYFMVLFRCPCVTKYGKMYKRQTKRVNVDMDVLKMVKMLRRHSVALWCLMNKSQRKFSNKLANNLAYLSEHSDKKHWEDKYHSDLSNDSEINENDIANVLSKSNQKNSRLIHLYMQQQNLALPPKKESIELALVETNDITTTPITENEF
jgi:beta-galactosidase/beta-glucuronidase